MGKLLKPKNSRNLAWKWDDYLDLTNAGITMPRWLSIRLEIRGPSQRAGRQHSLKLIASSQNLRLLSGQLLDCGRSSLKITASGTPKKQAMIVLISCMHLPEINAKESVYSFTFPCNDKLLKHGELTSLGFNPIDT